MAGYKVIQDVEAEDKLIGPLSLRQFIYAGITVIFLYLCFFAATHGASLIIPIFLLPAVVTAFFAFPWGRDQPTEVWALAKIRFMLKPRRRIWDQSGVKELVTITAPKQVVTEYTKGFSQSEVKSRLRALADTIDSRGWAIKNTNLNLYATASTDVSDRLIGASSLPQPVDNTGIQAADDIMDERSNANAQRLDEMIEKTAKQRREKLIEGLDKNEPAPQKPANYWFLNQPAQAAPVPTNQVTFSTQVVTPGMTEEDEVISGNEEAALAAQLEARKDRTTDNSFGHLKRIVPLSEQPKAPQVNTAIPPLPVLSAVPPVEPVPPPPPAPTPMPAAAQAALKQLAGDNDKSIATIAKQAQEVVIKLH